MPADETTDAAVVLRARARLLARPAEDEDDDGSLLLVLRTGHFRIGAPLERAAAVLPPGPTVRVPAGDHALVALRPCAGDLLPVADIGALLGAESLLALGARHVVVLDDDAPLGVFADAVEGITDLPRAGLHPLPDDGGFVRGVTDGLLVVDVDAVLADPRLTTVPRPQAPDA